MTKTTIFQEVQEVTIQTDLPIVIERLQYDWNFIAAFLNSPENALKEFNLDIFEFNALKTRDHRALEALGIDENAINIAMSTTHSSTCPM